MCTYFRSGSRVIDCLKFALYLLFINHVTRDENSPLKVLFLEVVCDGPVFVQKFLHEYNITFSTLVLMSYYHSFLVLLLFIVSMAYTLLLKPRNLWLSSNADH